MNTRTTTLSRRRIAAIASAVAAALSHGAQAQSDQSRMVLEEVVVSAERREVNLQDVPISATVLTGESLAAQGIDNIIEIQQVAPSVAINTYNRSTFINIRGVGIAQSAPTSNPGVAYYIDGVFIPHEQFIAQSFFDIESLEVLRGPQGTLTGQNSTGGAVYVRTPAPTFGEFSGYLDQTIADYDWYRTVGAVNVPVSDTLAIRVTAHPVASATREVRNATGTSNGDGRLTYTRAPRQRFAPSGRRSRPRPPRTRRMTTPAPDQ